MRPSWKISHSEKNKMKNKAKENKMMAAVKRKMKAMMKATRKKLYISIMKKCQWFWADKAGFTMLSPMMANVP